MSVSYQIHNEYTLTPSCRYHSFGKDDRFYVVCGFCDRVHGLRDSRTKRAVAFSSRAAADRVARVLNAQKEGAVC